MLVASSARYDTSSAGLSVRIRGEQVERQKAVIDSQGHGYVFFMRTSTGCQLRFLQATLHAGREQLLKERLSLVARDDGRNWVWALAVTKQAPEKTTSDHVGVTPTPRDCLSPYVFLGRTLNLPPLQEILIDLPAQLFLRNSTGFSSLSLEDWLCSCRSSTVVKVNFMSQVGRGNRKWLLPDYQLHSYPEEPPARTLPTTSPGMSKSENASNSEMFLPHEKRREDLRHEDRIKGFLLAQRR
ncbi:hypothetical protein HPP92_029009 [Vanilla planifolia]|uniref:Uncharacterized protein n=1 Tax=Vanilla planifolia TaxID=51239 RepID=A0A835P5W7_VANPL|nr:hypothetical protein HPP92_029009 [Vanilla planifolia]KAG0446101.1 hypothetical protein HPP92_028997 [Vanilla planifolia]